MSMSGDWHNKQGSVVGNIGAAGRWPSTVKTRDHNSSLFMEDSDMKIIQDQAQDAAGVVAHQRSEEHTSELQSLMRISYAVICLKKKTTTNRAHKTTKTT